MAFKSILIFLLWIAFVTPSLFADRVDRMYQKTAKQYHELYKDTPYRKKADNWEKTIKRFQSIYKKYPRHIRASQSLYNVGNLYRSLYKWNHKSIYMDRSNIAYRTLVNEYPKSNLADDAQYKLAENYDVYKKDKNLAFLEYKKLITHYPKSKHRKVVKKRLLQLRPPHKDLQIQPVIKNAVAPVDLTKARYGGLSKEESIAKKTSVLVSKVDYWSTSDWSRMVINVKEDVRYKYQVLRPDKKNHRGERLYIDILKSYLPKKFKHRIAANDGLIKQARIGQFDKETVRIVLDMQSLERIKVFHFKLPHQYKIVIDILGKAAVAGIKQPKKRSGGSVSSGSNEIASALNEYQSEASYNEKMISLSKALGLKVKRIIIDPGHGGKDPGALGFGLMEKDIALKIGHTLKRIIKKKHPDIEVLMTREKDVFISLEARTAFANQNKGDLFISIHLNASPKKRVSGIETYFLSFTTDNDALALAAKENQASLQSISNLQNILKEMITNSKIKESSELAASIQKATHRSATKSGMIRPRNLGVKRAPFFVLVGAQMPAVLIESGFITNPKENKLFKSKKYLNYISTGIYEGIKSYIAH